MENTYQHQTYASMYVTPEQLGSHFQGQFHSEERFDTDPFPPEIQHYGEGEYAYLKGIQLDINEDPSTAEEIQGVLKTLQKGRSVGTDAVPMEAMNLILA